MRLIAGTHIGNKFEVRTIVSNFALHEECAVLHGKCHRWHGMLRKTTFLCHLLFYFKIQVPGLETGWICLPSLENIRRVLNTNAVVVFRLAEMDTAEK